MGRRSHRGRRKERDNRGYGGMKIKLSFTVAVMFAVAVAAGYLREALSYAAAVILHEFAHATVAARFGFTLNTLKIMPYGASLTGEFDGAKPKEEFFIAAAGPLSNALFAVLFIAAWWLVPSLYYYTEIYVTANVFTALVNLLPVFPLDGGRAALALLSVKIPRDRAYRGLRMCGFFSAAVLIIVAVVFHRYLNFSYFTFFVFALLSSVFPDKNSRYQRLYGMSYRMEKIRSGLTVREVMIHRDATLLSCSKLLSGSHYTRFIVIDDCMKVLGAVSESQLEEFMAAVSPSGTIFEAMHRK